MHLKLSKAGVQDPIAINADPGYDFEINSLRSTRIYLRQRNGLDRKLVASYIKRGDDWRLKAEYAARLGVSDFHMNCFDDAFLCEGQAEERQSTMNGLLKHLVLRHLNAEGELLEGTVIHARPDYRFRLYEAPSHKEIQHVRGEHASEVVARLHLQAREWELKHPWALASDGTKYTTVEFFTTERWNEDEDNLQEL